MPTDPNTSGSPDLEIKPLLEPSRDFTSPAGFAAPPALHSQSQQLDRTGLLKAASRVMQDPLLLRRLSDRVYELMLEDLRYQRERSRNYGSRLNA